MLERDRVSVLLVPFDEKDLDSDVTLEVIIKRSNKQLTISYILNGNINKIILPKRTKQPKRLDSLWKSTCFEAFFALDKEPGYWELNISPSGDWNIYRFEGYRQGQVEANINSISYEMNQSEDFVKLTASIDLTQLNLSQFGEPFAMSVTAVLESKNHAKSYWAVKHAGKNPDFHLRQSFCIRI